MQAAAGARDQASAETPSGPVLPPGSPADAMVASMTAPYCFARFDQR